MEYCRNINGMFYHAVMWIFISMYLYTYPKSSQAKACVSYLAPYLLKNLPRAEMKAFSTAYCFYTPCALLPFVARTSSIQ